MSTLRNDPFSVKGKVVIVTGAAGNLGVGYVRSLMDAGAIVYAWDTNIQKLALVFGDLPLIKIQNLDITSETDVRVCVSEILATEGHIDGLINNAALNPAVGGGSPADLFAPYETYSIELFRKELDVNVTGMMVTMKAVAPAMIAQSSGSIINIASDVALAAHDHRVYQEEGKYKSPGYTASKTAVIGLSRQWAARLGVHNVRVNAVSISGVHVAGMPEEFVKRFGHSTMLMRMARLNEYNATMQYLLSDASSFMTGSNLVIDGGRTAW